MLLLDFCLGALPDVFQLFRGSDGVKAVRVPDEKEDEAVAIYERLLRRTPSLPRAQARPSRGTDGVTVVTTMSARDLSRLRDGRASRGN